MKNKKNLIFISLGVIILLITIFISYTYYQKNMSNKINEFSSYINKYKQEMSNYSLGDKQESYDNLITESEQIIANKDYKKIDSLTSRLNELKENIIDKNNENINSFIDYINTYKEEMSNYNLDDSKEKYNSLISEVEQAIANKDYKNIDSLISNLNKFKEEILNKNMELINSTISELESTDISKISDKESITNKIEEIKKLKDEKQFVKANELASTLKEDINNRLEVIKKEEKSNKFNIYTALNYLLESKEFNFLENQTYTEYPNPSIYIAYFDFTDKNSKTNTEIYFYEPNVTAAPYLKVNPKYSDLKYYIIDVKQRYPDSLTGESIRYGILNGIIYENGVYEEGGYMSN